jgi:hypothetical protein
MVTSHNGRLLQTRKLILGLPCKQVNEWQEIKKTVLNGDFMLLKSIKIMQRKEPEVACGA